jgi:hypothetical protein
MYPLTLNETEKSEELTDPLMQVFSDFRIYQIVKKPNLLELKAGDFVNGQHIGIGHIRDNAFSFNNYRY